MSAIERPLHKIMKDKSVIEKFGNRVKVQAGNKAPEGYIFYDKAFTFGAGVVVRSGIGKFPKGERGACWNNSLTIAYNNDDTQYCLGFAAGAKGHYEPHAWIKKGDEYYEVSPQETGGQTYVMCFEGSFSEFEALTKFMTGESIVSAPMIDLDGSIIICNMK